MEEFDVDKEWREQRNEFIQILMVGALYGLVIGFCLGCYC